MSDEGPTRLLDHFRGDADRNVSVQSQPAARSRWKPLAAMALVATGLGTPALAPAKAQTAGPQATRTPSARDKTLEDVELKGLGTAYSFFTAMHDTAMLAPKAERKPFASLAGYDQANIWEQSNPNLSDARQVYNYVDKPDFTDQKPTAFGQDIAPETFARAAKAHDPASRRITAFADAVTAARSMGPEAQLFTINSMGNALVQADPGELAAQSIPAYATKALKVMNAEQSLTKGGGVCEEQTIVKIRGLRALGYGPDRAQVIHVVETFSNGMETGHSIPAVDIKGTRYILDNRFDRPIGESAYFNNPSIYPGTKSIRPVNAMDENGITTIYEFTRSQAAEQQQKQLAAASPSTLGVKDLPPADQRAYLREMVRLSGVPKAKFPSPSTPQPYHHHARVASPSQAHVPQSQSQSQG